MEFTSHLQLQTSATVAINSEATLKRARGERVYNLSAGEPILPPHPLLVAAANQAMQAGKTLYPPVLGVTPLREKAAEWLNQVSQTQYSSTEVLATCGGKFGIFATLQAYLNPGDEVLIVSPYWVSYPELVKLFGGVPKIISTTEEEKWKVNVEQLEAAVSPKTKFLIFNNGSNPTGALYTKSELEPIVTWSKNHELLVISDEVYSGLTYDEQKFISWGSFADTKERLVLIQSCSKHFAMTGWRVGLVFAPKKVIQTLATIQSQSTTGTSSISQWVALAALEHHQEIMPAIQSTLERRRDVFVDTVSSLFGSSFLKPSCGLYTFWRLSDFGINESSTDFCEYLIKECNIAAVPGLAFGAEGYIRFSFGETELELKESAQAFFAAVEKWPRRK